MIDILPPRCRQCRSRRCGDEGHPRLGHNWTTMQPLWMTLGNDGVHALPTYGTWTIKCYCRLLLMNGKCSDRHLISTTCFVTSSVQVKLVTYSIVTSWSQKEQNTKRPISIMASPLWAWRLCLYDTKLVNQTTNLQAIPSTTPNVSPHSIFTTNLRTGKLVLKTLWPIIPIWRLYGKMEIQAT